MGAHEGAGDGEALYRSLTETAQDAIICLDPGGIISLWNPAATRMFGYSASEALGLDLHAVIAPERDRARAAVGLRGFFETGEGKVVAVTSEAWAVRRDGTEFPVELTVSALRVGGRWRATGIVRDITARKQAEAALATRTRQLEAVRTVGAEITRELDLPRLLALIVERALALLEAERCTLRLWNESAQVLDGGAVTCGLPLIASGPLRLDEGVSGVVARRRDGLIVNAYEAFPQRIPEPQSPTPPLASVGVPLLYRDRLVGVVVASHHTPGRSFSETDLGSLRLLADQAAIAIENARLHETALRRADQFATLNTLTQTVMAEIDPRRAVEAILAAAVVLLPDTVAQVWEQTSGAETLRLTAATASGPTAVPVQRSLRIGEGLVGLAMTTGRPATSPDVRADARWVNQTWAAAEGLVTAIAVPMRYQSAARGALVVLTRQPHEFSEEEVTLLQLFAAQAAIALEKAGLFAELNASYASLQGAQAEMVRTEKLRALGQMAAGIAHDLNNMLAVILGQANLLRLRTSDPAVAEALTHLETAATDGAQVVRRLQDFSRQRTAAPLAPVDLGGTVREALAITRPRWEDEAQRRGQRIAVETALPPLPPVLGYAPEMREVFTNLIFNAVDAMPSGGILTITGEATGDGIVLRVTDTGAGMSEAVRQKVFEPFFTTKGVQGTGLGLAVVYGIMERHGGRIEITSAPGRGTTVTLHFQAAPTGVEAAPATVSRRETPRRLLLIDDDAMVRSTLGSLLRAVGHTVVEAENGRAGLAILAETPTDCVLTDLGMPEMTGWEVARAIKARDPKLPVILLTGWGDQTVGDADDREHVDRVLGKPVSLQSLLPLIGELTEAPGA
jgi:PAS domain S-box-containing protein